MSFFIILSDPALVFVFQNSASGTGTTITLPGSLQADDLCIIANYADSGTGTPSTVVPADFTQLRNASFSGALRGRGIISAKKLVGSETTSTGMNGNAGDEFWIAMVFRPNKTWTSWTDHDTGNAEVTSGNPAAQTITTGGGTPFVMAYGMMGASASVDPRTTSPAMDEIGSGQLYAHYKLYAASPANHSYDMDDEGLINMLESGWLSFT